MRVVAFGCLALICVFLISSLSFAVENGAVLYGFRCGHCHGSDGAGKTEARKKMAVPDLRDKKFVEMTDKQLVESIGKGKDHKEYPHTFLYTGMTEDEIQEVVVHIRKLQKK